MTIDCDRAKAVSTAIRTRRTCRAFLDREVSVEIVNEILTTAARAPSGGNLQPWKVYVLRDDAKNRLVDAVVGQIGEQPRGEGADYPIYPDDMVEPWRSRRFAVGEQLYATLGIGRDDRAGRRAHFARNFRFFDAPVGLIVTIDRRMGPGQYCDIGLFLGNVSLLARERGLHTALQEAWAMWPRTVARVLKVPDSELVFCGVALGFADPDAAVNGFETPRADLSDFVVQVT